MGLARTATAALVAGALLAIPTACRRRSERPAGAPTGGDGAPPAALSPPPATAVPVPSDAALGPDYDPAKLVQDGADPVKVYLAEPRNAAWASAVENVIGGQIARDVRQVTGGGAVSMGCRTLTCLILVGAPAGKMDLALGVAQLVTLGPVTTNLGPSPDGRGQILFLTERRMANPADFTAWYQRTRRTTLDAIRAGTRPNPLPISASALPK